MATQVQRRRGTTAENDAFTGAIGEFTYDTDLNEIRAHDGSRSGGFNIPNFNSIQKRLYSYDASPGGTSTAITCSTQADPVALTSGLEVTLKMASTASGASTLTWGSLATKNIKKYSSGAKADIEADDWVSGQEITFYYDGTDWIAQLGGGGGAWQVIDTYSPSAVSSVGISDNGWSGYAAIKIIFQATLSTTSKIGIRFSTNGGSTYITSQHFYISNYATVDGGSTTTGSGQSGRGNENFCLPFGTLNLASNSEAAFETVLTKLTESKSTNCFLVGTAKQTSTNDYINTSTSYGIKNTSVINYIEVYVSAGTMTGEIRVLGVV